MAYDPKTLLNVPEAERVTLSLAEQFRGMVDEMFAGKAKVTSDASLRALYAAIAKARDAAEDDSAVGLSVAHSVDGDEHTWTVSFAVDYRMTILGTETCYAHLNSVDIATNIVNCWDCEWDD